MNRRGFLSFLGAAVAGATLDPERLLWKPGAKTISIPSPLLSFSMDEFREAYLRPLAIEIANQMDRDALNWIRRDFESTFLLRHHRRVGDIVQIRRPRRYAHVS
jgi:hypothetical protein